MCAKVDPFTILCRSRGSGFAKDTYAGAALQFTAIRPRTNEAYTEARRQEQLVVGRCLPVSGVNDSEGGAVGRRAGEAKREAEAEKKGGDTGGACTRAKPAAPRRITTITITTNSKFKICAVIGEPLPSFTASP